MVSFCTSCELYCNGLQKCVSGIGVKVHIQPARRGCEQRVRRTVRRTVRRDRPAERCPANLSQRRIHRRRPRRIWLTVKGTWPTKRGFDNMPLSGGSIVPTTQVRVRHVKNPPFSQNETVRPARRFEPDRTTPWAQCQNSSFVNLHGATTSSTGL